MSARPLETADSHVNKENVQLSTGKHSTENANLPSKRPRLSLDKRARVPLGGKDHNKGIFGLQRSKSTLVPQLRGKALFSNTPPVLQKSNSTLGLTSNVHKALPYRNTNPHKNTIFPAPEPSRLTTDLLVKRLLLPQPPLAIGLNDTLSAQTVQLHASHVKKLALYTNVDPVKQEYLRQQIEELAKDPNSVEHIPKPMPALEDEFQLDAAALNFLAPRANIDADDLSLDSWDEDNVEEIYYDEEPLDAEIEKHAVGLSTEELNQLLEFD